MANTGWMFDPVLAAPATATGTVYVAAGAAVTAPVITGLGVCGDPYIVAVTSPVTAQVAIAIGASNGLCGNIMANTQPVLISGAAYGVLSERELPLLFSGYGPPLVDAAVGSLYSRRDGGTGTSFYVKEPEGWIAVTGVVDLEAGDMFLAGDQTITGAKTFDVGSFFDKGNEVFNAKAFGAIGDGVADDTAELQVAINAAATANTPLYIPDGTYKTSAPLVVSSTITIRGDHLEWQGTGHYGDASYANEAYSKSGTWIVPTHTTGIALDFNSVGDGYISVNVENIGIRGPGAGSLTGVRLAEHTNRSRLKSVRALNCSVGISITNCFDNTYVDLAAWGCETGLYINGANQSVLVNTDIQVNKDYGVRVLNTSVCTFAGGVTEANNGTPISLESASSECVFENWYFEDIQSTWPAPVFFGLDVDNGCDYNAFRNCHFGAAVPIRLAGNHNQLINVQGSSPVTITGNSNVLIGTFVGTITEAAAGTNIIFDAYGGRNGIMGDFFIKGGKKVYLNGNAASANYIGRTLATGDTEISTATSGIKLLAAGGVTAGVYVGSGAPEGAVAATVGSLYLRTGGGAGTSLYVKESGTSTVGWVPK